MLKCLAILAVLMISVGVPVDAQKSANPTDRTQVGDSPAKATVPVPRQDEGPTLRTNANQEERGSEHKPLRVSLPSRDKYDWIAYGANLLLVLVGIAGVVAATCTLFFIKAQVLEMRRQRIAMQKTLLSINRQADLTQQGLELQHRPWISVDVVPESPIVFDERGCVMTCKITMTNVGHSVAKHVSLWTDFAIPGLDDSKKVRDRLCDIMKQPQNENSDYGWLLFPGQQAVEHRPVIASPEKVQKAIDLKVFQGLNAIGLHLVGCVDYPSPIDPKDRHQTRFEYIVAYMDMAKGAFMGAFDPTTKTYSSIVFSATMHGASAD